MKAVFFDLDNTLYDVRQYNLGAFRDVSGYLSKKYNLPTQKIYKELVGLWEEKTSRHPYLFDDLFKIFGWKKDLEKVVAIFNNYKGKIKPYFDAVPLLKELKNRDYKLGIITDGKVERQARKIKKLGIGKFFDIIIYTRTIEPKPSEKPFLAAIYKLGMRPEIIFYVADNPFLDFIGAKKAGMKTIRIKRGEFAKIPKNRYMDFEVDDLKEIINLIG